MAYGRSAYGRLSFGRGTVPQASGGGGPATQTINVAGIASTAALGSPTLSPGALTLSAAGIASTAALGAPALSASYTLSGSGIGSTASLGTPSVSLAGGSTQTISAVGIASTAALGSPSTSASVTLSAAGIASTAALGSPALSPGAFTISAAGIASASQVGTPTFTAAFSQTISAAGIPSTVQFGQNYLERKKAPVSNADMTFGTLTLDHPPDDPAQVALWAHTQFTRMTAIVNRLAVSVPQVAYAAPDRPQEGMIRLAKGGWNPTAHAGYDPQVGVLVRYVGGAWTEFA